MWDTIRLSAMGNFSLRKIVFLLAAVITSALFMAIANSPTSFAADATWSGDSITFNGDTYTKQTLTLPGTDSSSQTFVAAPKTDAQPKIAKVIVIPGNADTTKDVSNAREIDYTLDSSNNYTNPSSPKTLSVSAKGDANATGGAATNTNNTSCAIDGIGWIVCSTSRFMANSMDKVYGWISNFLTVKPLTTDTNSGLFQAWNIVRGFANACFILAFLVIIYSQITSVGISNYEIKKMIPRLIIAAILVNVSYYICTIAVDISNIMGDSVQQAFTQVRESLPDPIPQIQWSNMTNIILGGGSAVGVGALGIAGLTGATAGGSIAALATLLFPVLVMGVLSILVALMILAARQALIIVLVVLSPLAFVAFLLPNTEKQFEQWRKLFMTMLLVFPMFSLLFGGSQLASQLIIQSTDQLSVVVLALFVQVAPLALTPFLVRFSGSLLGKLAGMVNNPQKGLVDRTRNWSKDKADTLAKRRLAKGEHQSKFTPGGYAHRRSMNKRHREGRKKVYETRLDAAWASDARSQNQISQVKQSELKTAAGNAIGERLFEEAKANPANTALQNYNAVQRLEQSRVKTLQATDDARWDEAQSGKLNPTDNAGHRYLAVAPHAAITLRERSIAESNASIAQALQKSEFATELSTNVDLQLRAGGIGGEQGAIKVKAKAMSEVVKAGVEAVDAIKTASDIKPGDIDTMEVEFRRAVASNDIASLRAHTDMLASSKDAGIDRLRTILKETEGSIRANADMLETYRHHVNSNAELNQGAEDIGVWSRDNYDGWRSLDEIGNSHKTWKNLNVSTFANMKASTQRLALDVTRDDGSWAITEKMASEIINSPVAWSNIKDEVKPLIEARAENYMPVRGRR